MNPWPQIARTIAPTTRPGNTTLFLAPPLTRTVSRLRHALKSRDIAFGEVGPLVLAIPLEAHDLDKLATVAIEGLNEAERRDTKAMILAEGAAPTVADLLNSMPLSTLIAKVQERWLVEMIRDRRLTTHFQPIVRTDARSEIFGYECLLRGRSDDGTLLAPSRMYEAARDAELLFQLDRAARLTAIREAKAHRVRERLFVNFDPSTIYDPDHCLKGTISAVNAAGIDPSRIIFEVVDSEQVDADVDLLDIITCYRRAGFGVALDNLGAGWGSLSLLNRLRPDFVKLDKKLVRGVDQDRYKADITATLLEMARALGVATVGEGVETAGELAWLREHGVDFVQGYYIARPASPPPRLLGADGPVRLAVPPLACLS